MPKKTTTPYVDQSASSWRSAKPATYKTLSGEERPVTPELEEEFRRRTSGILPAAVGTLLGGASGQVIPTLLGLLGATSEPQPGVEYGMVPVDPRTFATKMNSVLAGMVEPGKLPNKAQLAKAFMDVRYPRVSALADRGKVVFSPSMGSPSQPGRLGLRNPFADDVAELPTAVANPEVADIAGDLADTALAKRGTELASGETATGALSDFVSRLPGAEVANMAGLKGQLKSIETAPYNLGRRGYTHQRFGPGEVAAIDDADYKLLLNYLKSIQAVDRPKFHGGKGYTLPPKEIPASTWNPDFLKAQMLEAMKRHGASRWQGR